MKKILSLLLCLLLLASLGSSLAENASPSMTSFTFTTSDFKLHSEVDGKSRDLSLDGLTNDTAVVFGDDLFHVQNLLRLNNDKVLDLTAQLQGGRLYVKMDGVGKVLTTNVLDLLQTTAAGLGHQLDNLLHSLSTDLENTELPDASRDVDIIKADIASVMENVSVLGKASPDEKEKARAKGTTDTIFYDPYTIVPAYTRHYDLPTENIDDFHTIKAILHMIADGLDEDHELVAATSFLDKLVSISLDVLQDDLDNPKKVRFDMTLLTSDEETHTFSIVMEDQQNNNLALKGHVDGKELFDGFISAREGYSIVSLAFGTTILSAEHITIYNATGKAFNDSYLFRYNHSFQSSELYMKVAYQENHVTFHTKFTEDQTLLDLLYEGDWKIEEGNLTTEGDVTFKLEASDDAAHELRFRYKGAQIQGAMISDLSQKECVEIAELGNPENEALGAEIRTTLLGGLQKLISSPAFGELLMSAIMESPGEEAPVDGNLP